MSVYEEWDKKRKEEKLKEEYHAERETQEELQSDYDREKSDIIHDIGTRQISTEPSLERPSEKQERLQAEKMQRLENLEQRYKNAGLKKAGLWTIGDKV